MRSFDQVERLPINTWEPETGDSDHGVVLLHGCSGWHGGNIDLWANWFVDRGYIAVAVDSNGPRGVNRDCAFEARVHETRRAIDGYSALQYLVNTHEVEADKSLVVGFSRGAASAIKAMQPDVWRANFSENDPKFGGAIAFYPECLGMPTALYAPVQVIIGEKDSLTRPEHCTHWKTLVVEGQDTLQVNVIDNAFHSFDQFTWRGQPVSRRNLNGHLLAPSTRATDEAKRIVEAFLTPTVRASSLD